MWSSIKSFGEKIKRSASSTSDGTASIPAVAARLPLTPLEMANFALPTLTPERDGKVRKGKRGTLIDLIESYNKINDPKLRTKKRNEIRKIQFEWLVRLRNEARNDDSPQLQEKINEVEKWEASYTDITQEEERFNASFASIPAVTSLPLASSVTPISHVVETKEQAAPIGESKEVAISQERRVEDLAESITKYLNQSASKYNKDRSFLATHGTNSSGSPVGWKAHIGATTDTAMDVLNCVIPLLNEKKISHKVDLNPKIFSGNNKFITIYPPGDEKDWEFIVSALNVSLAHVGESVRVPGELLVGTKGLVSMRYGQISAVSHRSLLFNAIAFKMTGANEYTLQNPEQYDENIKDGKLTFEGGTLTAIHKTKGKCTIVIVEGKVYVDLRDEPNPNNFPLPTKVELFGKLD